MLGLLQGVSELFPVSSLGHSVILPRLVGWNIHQNEPYFLTFLVATHLATALVLLGFFWQDWVRIVKGLGRSLRDREIARPRREARLAARSSARSRRASSALTARRTRSASSSPRRSRPRIFLDLQRPAALRRRDAAPARARDEPTRTTRGSRAKVGWWQSFTVGAAQAIALIPGLLALGRVDGRRPARRACRTRTRRGSRSCSRRRSSSPPPCSSCPISPGIRGTACAARRSSARSAPAFTAYLAVSFLMRYFETRTLTPFAIYCLCAGTAAAIYFAV